MIIDLRKIKRSGKESQDFFFEYAPERSLIDIPNVDFDGAIKISGSCTLTGEHSAYIDGEVSFILSGECTRCLEQTLRPYVIEFSEGVDSDSESVYPIKNDTVDLSKIVDDVIMMNIPVNFLCSEDCKGLCSGCGTNLNNGECKCKKQ